MSITTRAALIFFAVGLFLFLINFYLIRYHTRKAVLSGKRIKKGKSANLWGSRGKDGIVPKWVSYMGLLAFISFFMGVFMLVIRFVWRIFS